MDDREPDRLSRIHVFRRLDDANQLPRELLLQGRRYRRVGRPELAALLWVPGLIALMTVCAWLGVKGAPALALVVALLVGLAVFALRGLRGES